MKYDPAAQHRRSIRLRDYDYTQAGAYFVTVCMQNRKCLLGEIADEQMRLNAAGKMIERTWQELPDHYVGVDLDAYCVMPNHLHGIAVLVGQGRGQAQGPAPTADLLTLPDVIHRYKPLTTKRYADGVKHFGWRPFPGRLWQRNYWERIIRNEQELQGIREYIHNNPARWQEDQLNAPNIADL